MIGNFWSMHIYIVQLFEISIEKIHDNLLNLGTTCFSPLLNGGRKTVPTPNVRPQRKLKNNKFSSLFGSNPLSVASVKTKAN